MGYTVKHSKINKKITKTSRPSQAKDFTSIFSSGLWEDKRCFILGGGPSLKNFNFDIIKDELTIGINKAFMAYPCTINYSMDPKFYSYISETGISDIERKKLHEQWEAYRGIKVFLPTNSRKVIFDPSIYVLERTYRRTISFNLRRGIYGGYNSGLGALMLAICLGANPIYLLGFDMKIDHRSRRTHWHEGYPKQLDMLYFDKKLEKFKKEFERFAPTIKALGIDVINLSKTSELNCFTKSNFRNVPRTSIDAVKAKMKSKEAKKKFSYDFSKLKFGQVVVIPSAEDLRERKKIVKEKKDSKKETKSKGHG